MHVFLHIPRTAGTSIKSILRAQYERASSFYIIGYNPSRSLQTLKDNADAYKQLQLVHGHMDFGAVSFLGDNLSYIAMMRDPVDRIVSHYYYVKQEPRHYLHREIVDNNVSLNAYLSNGYTRELNDGLVRMFIGAGGHHTNEFSKYDIPYGETEEWMLEEAVKNIEEHFVFVGLQEKFDVSVFLMKKRLGWANRLVFGRVNQTRNRLRISDIDASTVETINNYNRLDVRLYELVRSQFDQELAGNKLYCAKQKALLDLNRISQRCKRFV